MNAAPFTRAALLIATLAVPAIVSAQDNPLSQHNRFMYAGVKQILAKSAEKMPEDKYDFRPTDAVRTFAQIIAHVTDWQYRYCSTVLGERAPVAPIEKTERTKAELVAALSAALDYCDRAYDTLTDSTAAQIVKLHPTMPMPKLGVLSLNNLHSTEHYGNLVTYMRINNIVPPSSEAGFTVQPPKK
jgi:uncharacterized damage-inducible protein DinB